MVLVGVLIPLGCATSGPTELQRAASLGQIEQVKLLAQDASTNDLHLALIRAIQGRHNEGVEVLLGAPAAKFTDKEMAGLLSLCRDGNSARLLVEAGAPVNHLDAMGRTPIFQMLRAYFPPEIARNRGYIHTEFSAALTLIKAGADLNVIDKDGQTPLHVAIQSGRPKSELLQLLSHGADPSIQDKEGRTALHLASMGKADEQLLTALVKGGADKATKDRYGRVPGDYLLSNVVQQYGNARLEAWKAAKGSGIVVGDSSLKECVVKCMTSDESCSNRCQSNLSCHSGCADRLDRCMSACTRYL